MSRSVEVQREMIESQHPTISIRRQCELIGLNRATFYREPVGETGLNLHLMRLIDEQYLRTPFYGYPKMTVELRRQGYAVNRKRVARLMQKMGLQALFPRRNLTQTASSHQIYPYLLRGLAITHPDQVWSSDITYIPMRHGFMYLVAIIDWYSRYVLAWQLSNTLEGAFCLDTLNAALGRGQPEIFNTDQGSQFTAQAFTGRLAEAGIRISMDGRGRALDNIFVERLWRTVKYEDIYLKDYETGPALERGLHDYFYFYNYERPHQSLAYRVPNQVYHPCETFTHFRA
jgi:putative transposase